MSMAAAISGDDAKVFHWSEDPRAITCMTLDGVASDLLGAVPPAAAASTFFCGNFGLLLLHAAHSDKVKKIIETMLRVTMMRGAQSAGAGTRQGAAEGFGQRGG